jgi:tRNA A-37 threonylcarbamoyl transferase component Bud32
LFLGSTQALTTEYPEGTNMSLSSRLCGEQRAILLEYLDREMLLPDNATEESMVKAIQYLERIHELSLLHGDVHQFMVSTLRNMMLLTNGDVKWIDFERSQIGAPVEELEFELGVVKAVIGPKGLLWRRRYAIPVV